MLLFDLQKTRVLADTALEFYQTRGRNFSITDVLEFLSSQTPNQNTQSLYATLTLLLDSGVLEPVTYQTYGFRHQMFQEYLAAVALARRCVDKTQQQNTWDLLWRKRRFSRWNEILRLLVGILIQEHGGEGFQIIREWLSALALEYSTSEGDPGNLCLILAVKSLGEFGESVSETAASDLAQHILGIWEKVFTELLRLGGWQHAQPLRVITAVAQDPTGDRTTRSEAMVVLNDLGINLPLDYLLQATRWCIYEGMGWYLADTVKRLGEQTPLEQLLPLLGEDHNRLQPGVVNALVGIADYIPLATILALLKDNNELVRHAAIRILGTMGERVPLHIFVALLNDPKQTLNTRSFVLLALGELGTPAAVDLLMEALEDDEPAIRNNALMALKDDDVETRRGGLRAFKEQGKEISLEPLLKLLNDPEDTIVSNSLAVLGELGSLGVAIPVEPLISLLSHEDEFIAGEAAEALCKFGERVPIDALLAHMHNTDNDEVRAAIFYALSSLEARIPQEAMLTVLSDTTISADEWRMDYALENLAGSMPQQILQRFHDDPRPPIRRAVLQAIQITRACEWLPLVLATLEDADSQYAIHDHNRHSNKNTIRTAVIQTLGALNACAPIEPLLLLLNKKETSYSALKALRQFGSRIPLTVLWPLLGSNHTETCQLAFEHLQENHPVSLPEIVPVLKAIVRGEPVRGAFSARMHYRIAETVALMGRATPAVLAMVIDLLDHPFWEVRERAVKTLGTLRRNIPDSAIRRLLELRKDPESPEVRAAADQALAEILSLEQGLEDE